MTVKEILSNFKNVAVVGMSKNTMKASNYVPIFMKNNGFNIIPINPTVDEIEGMKSYHAIKDIPSNIEILNVFRRSEDCLDVVREAIERKKIIGDIQVIWLQSGITNSEGRKLAEENGIIFIEDRCMKMEYEQL